MTSSCMICRVFAFVYKCLADVRHIWFTHVKHM